MFILRLRETGLSMGKGWEKNRRITAIAVEYCVEFRFDRSKTRQRGP